MQSLSSLSSSLVWFVPSPGISETTNTRNVSDEECQCSRLSWISCRVVLKKHVGQSKRSITVKVPSPVCSACLQAGVAAWVELVLPAACHSAACCCSASSLPCLRWSKTGSRCGSNIPSSHVQHLNTASALLTLQVTWLCVTKLHVSVLKSHRWGCWDHGGVAVKMPCWVCFQAVGESMTSSPFPAPPVSPPAAQWSRAAHVRSAQRYV